MVVVLASASEAGAGDITYNIVDYPLNETDQSYGTTDTLSGTIVTNGVLGLVTSADFLGGSWTISNASTGLSYTFPIVRQGSSVPAGSTVLYANQLYANNQELVLESGGILIQPPGGDGYYGVTYPSLYYDDVYELEGYAATTGSNITPDSSLYNQTEPDWDLTPRGIMALDLSRNRE